jgi:hypothetical protein
MSSPTDDQSAEPGGFRAPTGVVKYLLIPAVLVGSLLFIVGAANFGPMSRDITSPDGIPCDLPVQQDFAGCVQFEEGRSGSYTAEQSPLPAADRPFVRVEQPNNEVRLWVALASLAVVGAIALLGPSLLWRRDLRGYEPRLGRVGPKSPANLLGAIALAGVGLWAAAGFIASDRFVGAVVLGVLWLCVAPSLLGLLDSWTIAITGARSRSKGDDRAGWLGSMEREAELTRLQTLHERFIAVAGIDLALFVLWFSADADLRTALRVADVARQGGSYIVEPKGTGIVLAFGLLLSLMLALAFVPTAVQIRKLATEHVNAALQGLDWDADYAAAKQQRDARKAVLGIDQPLHSRFQQALVISAPLLTSLGTSILSI